MATERTFETVLKTAADGRLYLPVPFDPENLLDVPFRHLCGEINGQFFRGQPDRFDGERGVLVGSAWVRERGYRNGDRVCAMLKPEGPLREGLADDVAEALACTPAAAAFWDQLAPFYRKAYLRWIEATARRPEERARRIAAVVALLAEGHKLRPKP